jgi:hypothetical protein
MKEVAVTELHCRLALAAIHIEGVPTLAIPS